MLKFYFCSVVFQNMIAQCNKFFRGSLGGNSLLCIFLGGLGIHRFYAGKIGTGILWLLTGGLFGIGCLTALVALLTLAPQTTVILDAETGSRVDID